MIQFTPAMQRQHTAVKRTAQLHRNRGGGRQRRGAERMAAGQEREIDVGDVEHRGSAGVVFAPDLVDILARACR